MRPAAVARLIVITDTSANRARVRRLGPLLDPVYPLRGVSLRRWLAAPSGSVGGLMFLDTDRAGAKKAQPQRVRTRRVLGTGAVGGTTRSAG